MVHLFKRPMLGSQLEAMRAWPASLAGSESPALQALGAELLPIIAEADEAVKAKGASEQARDAFRDIDARKRYIDSVNAARKEAYGALAKMPHQHLGLPSSFADGFFRREAVKGEAAEEVTAAQLSSPLIYVASAAKLGRTTEEYRRILREDHITIRGAQ
jgi:hypothetical protein